MRFNDVVLDLFMVVVFFDINVLQFRCKVWQQVDFFFQGVEVMQDRIVLDFIWNYIQYFWWVRQSVFSCDMIFCFWQVNQFDFIVQIGIVGFLWIYIDFWEM